MKIVIVQFKSKYIEVNNFSLGETVAACLRCELLSKLYLPCNFNMHLPKTCLDSGCVFNWV